MAALAVLLFAYVLSQFFRAFLAIVAADLTRELGLDAAQLGTLSAVWFAAFAVTQFPVGVTLDRFEHLYPALSGATTWSARSASTMRRLTYTTSAISIAPAPSHASDTRGAEASNDCSGACASGERNSGTVRLRPSCVRRLSIRSLSASSEPRMRCLP